MIVLNTIPFFDFLFQTYFDKINICKKMKDKGEPDDETTLAFHSFGTNDSIFSIKCLLTFFFF